MCDLLRCLSLFLCNTSFHFIAGQTHCMHERGNTFSSPHSLSVHVIFSAPCFSLNALSLNDYVFSQCILFELCHSAIAVLHEYAVRKKV